MKVYKYPTEKDFEKISQRPLNENVSIYTQVKEILDKVKIEGDQALMAYGRQFDKIPNNTLLPISPDEMKAARTKVSQKLKNAIEVAIQNITLFHETQRVDFDRIETSKGVYCWQKYVPIEKVGLYVPGGTAPLLSTLMMLAIPAQIAGCHKIIVCTPPGPKGQIDPAILYLMDRFSISEGFKVGGAQAIAAMAYGTERILKVDKIFGPGNQYVTVAKQLVSMEGIAIDMPAGPSEVAIIADETANPSFVAADFLSQLEHGEDSQSIIVSTNEQIITKIETEVNKQLKDLPRKAIIDQSIKQSSAVIFKNANEIISFINQYAPEHLIISTGDNDYYVNNVRNAGSIFIGNYTPESAGDYASGTNHTLPTNGAAKAFSGLSTWSFMKRITYQEITREGIQDLGKSIEVLAEAEKLQAHKNAVSIRIKSIKK